MSSEVDLPNSRMPRLHHISFFLLGALSLLNAVGAAPGTRPLPRPLPQHPGNVFVEGEIVTVPRPSGSIKQWQLTDVDGRKLAAGEVSAERIDLGKLDVGFYRVTWTPAPAGSPDTAVAVLRPLVSPTPADSPICIQSWLAGNYILGRISSVEEAASLIALAGANGVRDVTAWTWLAGNDGSAIDGGTTSADSLRLILDAYAKTGLNLLLLLEPATPPCFQVGATWGARPRKKFPADYRDYAAFVRRLVEKGGSSVEAYEAWNEPEGIGGGYIGSETAAAAKVFRLAARSVSPSVHAAMGNGIPATESLERNDFVNAIDSYHYHAHKNPELTRQRRHTLDGRTGERPIWVTESSYGSYPLADAPRHRLSSETESRQAADVPKLFVRGLHDGNDRLYYFCLLDFSEESGQAWGLLLTQTLEPRPAYVAFAAAGRLLAGAKPRGSLNGLPEGVEGWLVESVIDGAKKKVAVVWKNDGAPVPWNGAGLSIESVWDVWGRKLPALPESIGLLPVYIVLKADSTPVVTSSLARIEKNGVHPVDISPVVADFRRPDRFKNRLGDFFLLTHLNNTLDIDLYNFSTSEQKGTWSAVAGEGITVLCPKTETIIAPGERAVLRVQVQAKASHADGRVHWIDFTGRFGEGSPSRLSLPVVFCPEELEVSKRLALAVTGSDAGWKTIAPKGTRVKLETRTDSTAISVELGEAPNKTVGTTWATAVYPLKSGESIPAGARGVTLRGQSADLPAGSQLSLLFIERSGAAYACALPVESAISSSEGQRFTLPFTLFTFQSYRAPYVDNGFDPEQIVSCEISLSALPGERSQIVVRELGWVLE